MQHTKRPYIEYEPRSKPKFIAKIAFVLIAILIVVAIVALEKDKRKNAAIEKIITADKGPLEVNRGQSLHTRFFDVIVDSAAVADKKVRTGQLINLPKDDSSRYFIIEIVLKNTDTESKLMPDGELMIESENGNEKIKFDNSITLIQEGWGQLMDNIGAGVTEKTKLVYKIPAGASGNAYYYPDILYSQDRIFLMKL
jgi:hypothetical protein